MINPINHQLFSVVFVSFQLDRGTAVVAAAAVAVAVAAVVVQDRPNFRSWFSCTANRTNGIAAILMMDQF